MDAKEKFHDNDLFYFTVVKAPESHRHASNLRLGRIRESRGHMGLAVTNIVSRKTSIWWHLSCQIE